MVWNINISHSPQLKTLLSNIFNSLKQLNLKPVVYQSILNTLGEIATDEIKRYITANQFRFSKTKNKLGISATPHNNYSPTNVYNQGAVEGFIRVGLNIKGIERNFRPVIILPKQHTYLTIPTDKESYNKSPREFNNLFKPKGKNVLAKVDKSKPNGLKVLYSLTRQVYQQMDNTMLPKESVLLYHCYTRLSNIVKNTINIKSLRKYT